MLPLLWRSDERIKVSHETLLLLKTLCLMLHFGVDRTVAIVKVERHTKPLRHKEIVCHGKTLTEQGDWGSDECE